MLDRLRAVLDHPNAGLILGVTVLGAAVIMVGATFTPFVTQGCIFCPLDYTIPARSLFQGLDSWIVLLVAVGLALLSVAFLMNRHRHTTAVACLGLAAAAVALCIFERVDAAGRVIGLDAVPPPVELGNPGAQVQGIPPPVYTNFGFYAFLLSAIVAVVAAMGVLVTLRSNPTTDRTTVAAVAQ